MSREQVLDAILALECPSCRSAGECSTVWSKGAAFPAFCLARIDAAFRARIRALSPRTDGPPADPERKYPCDDCGLMRTKAEGGTVFTVCDACWDKHHGKEALSRTDGPGAGEATCPKEATNKPGCRPFMARQFCSDECWTAGHHVAPSAIQGVRPARLRDDASLVAEVEDYIRTGPTPIDAVARILDAIQGHVEADRASHSPDGRRCEHGLFGMLRHRDTPTNAWPPGSTEASCFTVPIQGIVPCEDCAARATKETP